ncbi:DUF84 family protein [Rodentibacter pneumotropicus]|uniref:DUF84 family protein n=1 Tax=Rodentibacter pneumotropicus TaxID=758 RepID=UPI000984EE57|nr:inosine/xanthosine triphosphatase [Rodentibacter pneumotropicus]OOF58717.1 hypothetical protein BKL50_10975 [Rodentibacter pneumotropicus]
MQDKKLIVITTKNKAKIKALEYICKEIFSDYKIVSIESNSGVNETPTNDMEAIQGCKNRIENALKLIEYSPDYIISLEGLIEHSNVGTFVFGWAAIRDNNGNIYYGCSGKVMLPKVISDQIKPNIKLSDLIKKNYSHISPKKIDILGANGVVTDGLYTRVDEFVTSMRCAFGVIRAQNDKENIN